MAFLSTDLIAAIKRYSSVPTSQVTFTTIDFLAIADDQIRLKILPLVLSQMSEYYVYAVNFAINSNQNLYPIPSRATAMNLRSVEVASTTDPDSKVGLDQLNREDLYAGVTGNVRYLIKKNGFYIEGNNVVLYPMPVQSLDTLRLNIFMRPNQLVDPSACGLITSINPGLQQITCSGGIPSTWTPSNTVDLVKAQPGFDCTAIDQVITNIGAGVITFQDGLPENVSVGDYVCLAGQSCVVQVPVELQPLLQQNVVVAVLGAQGDSKLKDAKEELEKLEKNASLLLAPRVQGNVKRVTNARGINRWV